MELVRHGAALAAGSALALALAGCMTGSGRSTLSERSPKPFAEIAACAYSTLGRAHPGRVRFGDAPRTGSVRLNLQDVAEGGAGPVPRQVEITVAAAGAGSTVEIVSPTGHAEAVWTAIRGCT